MPVIPADALEGVNLYGADHGAMISLIFDNSEPGHARACTATPTTRPGWWRQGPSPSSSARSASVSGRATW